MSCFAGVVARVNTPIASGIREALLRISRNPLDEPVLFESADYCCTKVDIGAFRTSGHFADADGAFSVMAGEALLADRTVPRDAELRTIHEGCAARETSALRAATGAFCMVQYQPTTRTVRLISDKLGVRPLYYSITPDF